MADGEGQSYVANSLIRRILGAALAVTVGSSGAVVIATGPASAYCRTGMTTWNDTTYAKTLGVDPGFPSKMRTGLSNGLTQWNRSGSTLRYSTPDYTSGWMIYAFRGSHSYSPLMGSAPGYAQTMVSGSTHSGGNLILSNRFSWINGVQNISQGLADVQTIAVHEVGHFTGLAHPWIGHCTDGTPYTAAEQGSVMTTINVGVRRALNSDDIAGVTDLY